MPALTDYSVNSRIDVPPDASLRLRPSRPHVRGRSAVCRWATSPAAKDRGPVGVATTSRPSGSIDSATPSTAGRRPAPRGPGGRGCCSVRRRRWRRRRRCTVGPVPQDPFQRHQDRGDQGGPGQHQLGGAQSATAMATDVAVGTGSCSGGSVTLSPCRPRRPGPSGSRPARPGCRRACGRRPARRSATSARPAARSLPQTVRYGEPGQQRQPGPAGRRDGLGPQQHRHRDARAGRGGPGPALTSAAGRLEVGDQHRPRSSPGPSPPGQVGIGGAGLGHHVDAAPEAVGPDQLAAQGRSVDRVGVAPARP